MNSSILSNNRKNIFVAGSATAKSQSPAFNDQRIIATLMVLGILFRLRQYLFDRSLWLDESLLVVNILARPFRGLLLPLDHGQAAPFGFLILEKEVVRYLGSSELALRLVPFLCGIVSIFLFTAIARRYLKGIAIPIAVGLFAVSGPLIYYSSEAKQYSSDVAIALLLYLLASLLFEKPFGIGGTILVSIIGALAVWFSQPSIFILAGVGISGLWMCFRNKDRRGFTKFFIASAVWAGSFLTYYLFSLRGLTHNNFLLDYWQGAFAPLLPHSLNDLLWYVNTLFNVFSNPVGLAFAGLAAVAAVLGAMELFAERRQILFALLLPMALALLASGLHRYPFRERLLLFLVPSLILLVAAGLGNIHRATYQALPSLTILLLVVLFFQPALDAGRYLLKPQTKEEIRPVLAYIQQHRSPGDVLYSYHPAIYPLEYYSQRGVILPMQRIDSIAMRQSWQATRADLDRLRGQKRVWVLFSHVSRDTGVDEELLYLDYLNSMGRQLDSKQEPGASVYLYDLSSQGS
jgi:hypothetical protein